MSRILIIDDEPEVGNFLSHLLSSKGFQVTIGYSGEDFRRLLKQQQYNLALIDVKLPDADGLDILRILKKAIPSCKSIVMTGYSTVKTAIEAIKIGANDYIEKPFDDIDELEALIDHLLNYNQTPYHSDIHILAESQGFIVGTSKQMNNMLTLAYKIAQKNINVLIEGETGSGKEVLAQFIHHSSPRSQNPFVGLNCGALSESLLESELFGHEKGAFTGAVKDRKGVFEIANKGTLFLDEIAEASASSQVKLLRVIETGEYKRIGDESIRRTNTRIIAASHVNLSEAVNDRKFREDLLYRLDVVKLSLPPLRERTEDIPLFLTSLLKKYNSSLLFADESIQMLTEYDWPGNIRELVNVVKRALTIAEDETTIITPHYLPEKIQKHYQSSTKKPLSTIEKKEKTEQNLPQYLEKWSKQMLHFWEKENDIALDEILQKVKELEITIGKAFATKMMKETIGNRKKAAENLHISTRKLRYIMSEKN
ncbi:sigma-54-dependent transcriptional regulator [Bacillus massiliigorillae]|uniref:sigma-54-dependent transcriptional regulator n=1 Tax=Bacillus massiliigorillae TaxID=1243664 RepID=UPI0003A22A14|nr:sigma-54 dependent transcriptional regulator [Bacillus massiliigorillae]